MHISDVAIAYGMTETSPVSFQSSPDDPLDKRVSTVGRVKDMLIRGGENVYPREQIFGISDARYGEEACAWMVLKPVEAASEDDIMAFCQGQIAHYKIPRHVRFVGELPTTLTGEVQKFLMRARMVEELRLSEPRTA
jgi:fatty-acyl-CoA synthase